MLLAINVAARAVQLAVEPRTLAASHLAISLRESFINANPRLLSFEARGFAACKLAVAYAVAYAKLLVMLAPVYARRVRHRNDAQAERE